MLACRSSRLSSVTAYALGAIPRNPVRDLDRDDRPSAKRQTEPRYLSVGEVDRLLDELSDQSRPVASACFWGALRVSEALRLTWADVDFDTKQIAVPGSKSTASKASIPLLPTLAEELRAHRDRQGQKGFDRIGQDSLIFQTAGGLSPVTSEPAQGDHERREASRTPTGGSRTSRRA